MALINCPECDRQISDQAPQCPHCGFASQPAPAAASVGEDEFLDAAIGPTNKSYYRRAFDKFSSGQGSVTWNWPSFFVTIFWMFYRKMYVYALLVWFVLPVVLMIFAAIVGGISGDPSASVSTYYLSYAIIGFIIIPMFANRLYYRHVNKKISRTRAIYGDESDQLKELHRTGGTGGAGIIVAVVFGGIMIVGILAAIAVPAYQDYTIRAQVAEGLNLSAGAKAAVTEYILDRREYPIDNRSAGLSPANEIVGSYVSSVAIDEGQIVITYGNNAHASIQGRALLLVPDATNMPNVSWSCFSPDLENKWLPAACRSR